MNFSPQIVFCGITHGDRILISHQIEPNNDHGNIVSSLLPIVPTVAGERKITFSVDGFQAYILADKDGLFYFCITRPTDRHLLPFAFLDTLKTVFRQVAYIDDTFSENHQMNLETEFLPALTALTSKLNFGEGDKLSDLENQINDVKNILLVNVEKLLERGEKLEEIMTKSENLATTSTNFRQSARVVVRQQKCKNWKMWLVISLLLGTVLTIALLIATGVVKM